MSNESRNYNDIIEYYFKSEYNDLLRYAKRILMNDGLAEDAVQDTFQIAIRKPEKLAGSPNPVGWLYETLKNVLKNAQRDRRRYLRITAPPEAVPVKSISAEEITPKLTTLYGDDEEMRLLILFYGYGFRVRELAEMLGISESACKMRLKRGRERKKIIIQRE